ncbi:MAG TPA: hypothetical protein VKI44_15455 [Acetobacteraceae bacterium]|nr:hypothetical protein [Acetobacteraceae bacterium]
MKTFLSLVTALAIVAGSSAAFADAGDGPQFDLPQPVAATGPATTVVTAAPMTNNVDNAAEAQFAGQPAVIDENGGGGLLSMNGNEAPLQTANSVPVGFGVDTVQLAAHAAGFPHYAAR